MKTMAMSSTMNLWLEKVEDQKATTLVRLKIMVIQVEERTPANVQSVVEISEQTESLNIRRFAKLTQNRRK